MRNMKEKIQERIENWLKRYWHIIVDKELTLKIECYDYDFYLDHKKGMYVKIEDNIITLELMNESTIRTAYALLGRFEAELLNYVALEELKNG